MTTVSVMAIVGVEFVLQLFVSILQTYLITTAIKKSGDTASKGLDKMRDDQNTLINELDENFERFTSEIRKLDDKMRQLNSLANITYELQTLADKLKLLTEIDSTMSMMHNKLDDIARKMKACMAGLDDSTKKIFADLKDAVETSNVVKLASVVRAAQALSDNFDSIENRIYSMHNWPKDTHDLHQCLPMRRKKCSRSGQESSKDGGLRWTHC